MYLSEELRNSNISEYLLYMWQVEDMIRAAALDADRLYETVIRASGRSEADCLAWKQWYSDMADMMRVEGKAEKGHLQINENVLVMLQELHLRLLGSHKQPRYTDAYYKALPFIVEFRARNNGTGNDELRDCFNMLYGVLMLKLQHRPISEATAQAVAVVSAFLGLLSAYYKEDKAGTLDLD